MTHSAILSCSLQYSTARARVMPPKNIMFVWFMYTRHVSLVERTPNRGNKTGGRNAVITRGTLSVIQ